MDSKLTVVVMLLLSSYLVTSNPEIPGGTGNGTLLTVKNRSWTLTVYIYVHERRRDSIYRDYPVEDRAGFEGSLRHRMRT